MQFEDSDSMCSLIITSYTSPRNYIRNGNSITLHETKDKLKCEAQIVFLELSMNEIKVIPRIRYACPICSLISKFLSHFKLVTLKNKSCI